MDSGKSEDLSPAGGSRSGLRYALILAVVGVLVAGSMYQYVMRSKAQLPVPKVKRKVSPILHTRVNDIPADSPSILIGLVSKGHVLLDASALCERPQFRERSGTVPSSEPVSEASFVATAPDIVLPPRLRDTNWSIVSESKDVFELAATQAYQWQDIAYAPLGTHCLFVGKPMASFSPYGKFAIDHAAPVLALSAPAHTQKLQLIKQQDAHDIDANLTDFFTEKYPWLRTYEASRMFACEDPTVKPKQLKVLPIAMKTGIDTTPVLAWFVSSQCEEPEFRWALVIAKPDASFEMVAMEGTQGTSLVYFPIEAWVVDVNGDGIDEVLVKTAYYEGESYTLLKFVKSESGAHALREIATSAYYGL
ncbi:MAG: hypothetical protein V4627_16430 [Pseudomonadota bacterium]